MRLAIVSLFLVLAPKLVAAGAACPDNSIHAGCWPDAVGWESSLPAAQLGPNGIEPWNSAQPCSYGCYDLVAGKVVGVGYVNTQGGCLGGVQVSDVYTLLGPGNSPVAIQSLLQLQTTLPTGGHYVAHLYGPGGASDDEADTPDGELMIALSIVPGVPFTLHADVEAYGDQSIQPVTPVIVSGVIRFAVPAGYSIFSCRNYDVPTPARTSSWGGMKALYR
jgi:hypothetical protein